MSAGYSGTPLPKKLGIKDGHRVAILAGPERFALDLPRGVSVQRTLRGSRPFDVILLFVSRLADLEARFAPASKRLAQDGGLWVAWPKKSSGLQRDLGEAEVREHGLATGLVDNKICAVNETWSGLRFVIRLADRR